MGLDGKIQTLEEYCPWVAKPKKDNWETYRKEMSKSDNLEQILEERGKKYGAFKTQAKISQALKEVMEQHLRDNNISIEPYQKEALNMIFHKISRIINGNPRYIDSWRDVAGYAQLVVKELEKENTK